MPNEAKNNEALVTQEVGRSFREEFDCIQKAAHTLLKRPLCPKGVFRFKTHDEFEEWKKTHEAELPSMDTIRKFLNGQLTS